jgi:hypothetical protein
MFTSSLFRVMFLDGFDLLDRIWFVYIVIVLIVSCSFGCVFTTFVTVTVHTFFVCVLSCLDLKDDQLQKAFVARLLDAIFTKSWPLEMRSATMCSVTMTQLKSKGHDLEECDIKPVLPSFMKAKRRNGMTVLMWASCNGQEDKVRVLVSLDASLETVDREGMTVLMWASRHADAVRVTVEHGASLDVVDKRGNTALQLASDYGKTKVSVPMEHRRFVMNSGPAKLLCKHGARGALWYAAKNDLRDMVADLISKGHDLEECDKDGNTVLQVASKYRNRKVAKLLCKYGARGAFCYAAKNDLRDMVTELISKGHDLEECDKRGNTAL